MLLSLQGTVYEILCSIQAVVSPAQLLTKQEFSASESGKLVQVYRTISIHDQILLEVHPNKGTLATILEQTISLEGGDAENKLCMKLQMQIQDNR